jgi:hypothetical protein
MPDLTTTDPLQAVLVKLRADQASRVGRILRGADAEETLGSVTLASPGPELPAAATATNATVEPSPGVVANPDMGARGKIEAPPKPGDSGAWLRGLYYASRADQSPLGVR